MESDTVYDLGVSKSGLFEFKLDVKRGITIPGPNGDIEDAGGSVDVVLDEEQAETLFAALGEFLFSESQADKPKLVALTQPQPKGEGNREGK